jgi:hypothetical protein
LRITNSSDNGRAVEKTVGSDAWRVHKLCAENRL